MSEPTLVIDLDARRKADTAKDLATSAAHGNEMIADRLDSHLKSCERRYDESDRRHTTLLTDIKDGFTDQRKSTQRLHGRIDKLVWGVLAALIVVIAQIVLKKIGLL